MINTQDQTQALARAREEQAIRNYGPIFAGLLEKGGSVKDIRCTLAGWKALGRFVKKGERGVKVITFIDGRTEETDPSIGRQIEWSYHSAHITTVFHVLQTETETERQARLAASKPLGSGPLDWPREKRLRWARKVRAMTLSELRRQAS